MIVGSRNLKYFYMYLVATPSVIASSQYICLGLPVKVAKTMTLIKTINILRNASKMLNKRLKKRLILLGQ